MGEGQETDSLNRVWLNRAYVKISLGVLIYSELKCKLAMSCVYVFLKLH